jgi:hypothetical protein
MGNLVVLVPVDIVQNKHCAVAHGQPLDAALEIYPVNGSLQQQVRRPSIDASRAGFIVRVRICFDRDDWWRFPAQVHQFDVNRQPVQPGRQGQLTAKSVNFAKQEQKRLLESDLLPLSCFLPCAGIPHTHIGHADDRGIQMLSDRRPGPTGWHPSQRAYRWRWKRLAAQPSSRCIPCWDGHPSLGYAASLQRAVPGVRL